MKRKHGEIMESDDEKARDHAKSMAHERIPPYFLIFPLRDRGKDTIHYIKEREEGLSMHRDAMRRVIPQFMSHQRVSRIRDEMEEMEEDDDKEIRWFEYNFVERELVGHSEHEHMGSIFLGSYLIDEVKRKGSDRIEIKVYLRLMDHEGSHYWYRRDICKTDRQTTMRIDE